MRYSDILNLCSLLLIFISLVCCNESEISHSVYNDEQSGDKIYQITLDSQSATFEGTKQIYLKFNIGFYLEKVCETKMRINSENIICPTKDNWQFYGYYTNKNGNGHLIITREGYLSSDVTYNEFSNDVVLYAYWKKLGKTEPTENNDASDDNNSNNPNFVKYFIYYHNTYEVNNPNPKSFIIRDDVSLCDIILEHYYFLGWFYGQNDNAEKCDGWKAGDKADDVVLWAKWKPDTYNIIYKDKDNKSFSGSLSELPKIHIYDAMTTLISPQKIGYSFVGWYTDSECLGENKTVILAKEITSDITLYAKWIEGNIGGITVITPNYDDIEVPLIYENNQFRVSNEYLSYLWYIDGIKQNSFGCTFIINTDNLFTGTHSVSIYVTDKNGVLLVSEMEFVVRKTY